MGDNRYSVLANHYSELVIYPTRTYKANKYINTTPIYQNVSATSKKACEIIPINVNIKNNM
jgi:hypothetical protein